MSFKEGEPIDINNYLTIEALEDGLTAILYGNACEYCIDGDGNWKVLLDNVITEAIGIGHTLSFRGELTPTSSVGIGYFKILKKCNLLGNCMSMLFGDNAANNFSLTGKDYAFKNLFINCSNIVNISADFLPATTLADECYSGMFANCYNLITAPSLPAMTLVNSCYYDMFSGCTNLTAAPELPATALAYGCYENMFRGCTNLTAAPSILPATALASGCYENMFYGCKSLTQAPELPATTLSSYCYYCMFYNCSKLNYIKAMFTTDPSSLSNYTSSWVSGVSGTGTFVKNKNATWDVIGDDGIPLGWTVVNDGEESGDNGLTFPVYLITGNNGQLGIDVYNYFKENYSFGIHALDDNAQVYIDNELQSTVLVTGNVTFGNYLLLSDGDCNLQ